MPHSEDSFVLVARVWLHDGVPVARLLIYPPASPQLRYGTTVAGGTEITATIERLVTDLVFGTFGDPDPS